MSTNGQKAYDALLSTLRDAKISKAFLAGKIEEEYKKILLQRETEKKDMDTDIEQSMQSLPTTENDILVAYEKKTYTSNGDVEKQKRFPFHQSGERNMEPNPKETISNRQCVWNISFLKLSE